MDESRKEYQFHNPNAEGSYDIGLITHSFGRFRQELLRWVGNDTHIAMLIVSAGPLRVFAAHRVVT